MFCVSGSCRGGVTADVDFALALARAGDVVGRLHPHQRFHFRAESLFDPQRHVAGDRSDLPLSRVDSVRRETPSASAAAVTESPSGSITSEQIFAGVRRVQHTHGFLLQW